MPTQMKSGLSDGAAYNNINVIQMHYGRKMLRYTDRDDGTNDARAIISRVSLNEFDAQDAWTLKTS